MAAKVKQQTAPCAQAVTEQDLFAMEEEFNFSNAKESIFEQLNVIHPIHNQQYNYSMVENNTLKNLQLAILKLLCESFNLALPPGVVQRKRKKLISLCSKTLLDAALAVQFKRQMAKGCFKKLSFI